MRYFIITSQYDSTIKMHPVKAENGLRAHKKAKTERAGRKNIEVDEIVTKTLFLTDIKSLWEEKVIELKKC